jgi:hypothetical protein
MIPASTVLVIPAEMGHPMLGAVHEAALREFFDTRDLIRPDGYTTGSIRS